MNLCRRRLFPPRNYVKGCLICKILIQSLFKPTRRRAKEAVVAALVGPAMTVPFEPWRLLLPKVKTSSTPFEKPKTILSVPPTMTLSVSIWPLQPCHHNGLSVRPNRTGTFRNLSISSAAEPPRLNYCRYYRPVSV